MWTLIVALILIGLLLVILEIVFVPGTTIVGLAGVVLAGVGILFAYREFGNETGWYVLLGTAGLTAVALFFLCIIVTIGQFLWNKRRSV